MDIFSASSRRGVAMPLSADWVLLSYSVTSENRDANRTMSILGFLLRYISTFAKSQILPLESCPRARARNSRFCEVLAQLWGFCEWVRVLLHEKKNWSNYSFAEKMMLVLWKTMLFLLLGMALLPPQIFVDAVNRLNSLSPGSRMVVSFSADCRGILKNRNLCEFSWKARTLLYSVSSLEVSLQS